MTWLNFRAVDAMRMPWHAQLEKNFRLLQIQKSTIKNLREVSQLWKHTAGT